MKRETLPSHQTEIRWSISKSLSPSWMIRHSLFRNHFITRASGVWGSFWLVKLMSCLSCVGCDSCVSWAQFTCNHWEKPKICFEQPFDVRTTNAPKTSPCPDITRQKIWRQSKSYAAKALSSPRHNCAKNRQMLFSLPHLCKPLTITTFRLAHNTCNRAKLTHSQWRGFCRCGCQSVNGNPLLGSREKLHRPNCAQTGNQTPHYITRLQGEKSTWNLIQSNENHKLKTPSLGWHGATLISFKMVDISNILGKHVNSVKIQKNPIWGINLFAKTVSVTNVFEIIAHQFKMWPPGGATCIIGTALLDQ